MKIEHDSFIINSLVGCSRYIQKWFENLAFPKLIRNLSFFLNSCSLFLLKCNKKMPSFFPWLILNVYKKKYSDFQWCTKFLIWWSAQVISSTWGNIISYLGVIFRSVHFLYINPTMRKENQTRLGKTSWACLLITLPHGISYLCITSLYIGQRRIVEET